MEFLALSFVALSGLLAAIVDLRTLTVPKVLTVPLMLIGLAYNLAILAIGADSIEIQQTGTVLTRIVTGVMVYLVGLGLSLCSRKSLGMGDVKLLAGWALLVGPLALLAGLWLASLLGIGYFAFFMKGKKDREIPFAPFLAVGVLLAFLFRRMLAALF